MSNLDKASQALAEGEGTVGMLLHDPRLYEAALLSIERITDALDRVRRILDRWEHQGYIEFKAHQAVGPLDVKGKKPIPD